MIIKKMKNTKITNMKTGRGTKRVQSLASNLARNSPCNTKHGAIITNGTNKILASGFNTNTRSKVLNRHDCCMHAEMAAVNNFINCRVRRNPKRYCF